MKLTHLDRSKRARTQRKAAIRADRARGLTIREIAKRHGVSPALVHQVAADVQMIYINAWHRARLGKDFIYPSPELHRILAGQVKETRYATKVLPGDFWSG